MAAQEKEKKSINEHTNILLDKFIFYMFEAQLLHCFLQKSFGHTDRASGLFYRSLQLCPWVKVIYVLTYLISDLTSLKDITCKWRISSNVLRSLTLALVTSKLPD